MLPLRLSLQGFLSYREEQTIDFTGSSLWMLWGPNGVGKSAIFDAITFALYNTHRAVVGNSYNLADLMNHHSDKLIVVFDFLMSGEIYRIRRTCTRGRRTISSTREAFLLQGDDLANLEQMPATPIPNTDSETGFQQWIRQTIGLNYEAFASSVLLLQGKSERLLEANAEKRYATLAELIDLSYYQKLHTIAEKRCSEAKASANTLAKQLQGITPITDDTLALAQATADTKSEVLVKAQQRVEHLTALLEQAKQWEAGMAQLGVQKKKLQETLGILRRAEEIRNQFARLELLERIIPDLEQILSQRERLEQKEKEILPPEAIQPDAKTFVQRFGLREDEPLVRIRLLDDQLFKQYGLPLTDLCLPYTQLAQLHLQTERCIVTENKMVFLTLPHFSRTFAIFGEGFTVRSLCAIPWFASCPIFYWGDLDAQGFQILSLLRATFPHVLSLMMDEATLQAFSSFCVEGTPCTVQHLPYLTSEEQVLFQRLARENIRLEQERIDHAYALQYVRAYLE